MPSSVVRFFGRLADRLSARLERDLPVSAESAWMSTKVMLPDNEPTSDALGVTFRPLDQTLADQYAWQSAAGRA